MALLGLENDGNSGIPFLKLGDGDSIIFESAISGSEVVQYYEHVVKAGQSFTSFECLGKATCPACAQGLPAGKKFLIPIVADGKLNMWKCSKTTRDDLIAVMKEARELTNNKDLRLEDLKLKMTRSGTGRQTVYKLFYRGASDLDRSELDLPEDLESIVVKLSAAEIRTVLSGDTTDAVEPKSDYNSDPTSLF
jgi:hypothetical protein